MWSTLVISKYAIYRYRSYNSQFLCKLLLFNFCTPSFKTNRSRRSSLSSITEGPFNLFTYKLFSLHDNVFNFFFLHNDKASYLRTWYNLNFTPQSNHITWQIKQQHGEILVWCQQNTMEYTQNPYQVSWLISKPGVCFYFQINFQFFNFNFYAMKILLNKVL